MNRRSLFCLIAFSLLALPAFAADEPSNENRFESSIQAFEKADTEHQPGPGGIVFVGSSSIRMWDTEKWFPEQNVINRGFGGSQTSDVLHFFDRVIKKYEPRTIVFYCGDNDIAHGKTTKEVIADFRTLMKNIRQTVPGATVYYLPIKPSLKRWDMWDDMNSVNLKVQKMAERHDDLVYVDTATVLLNEQGEPRDDVFAKDGLHLNETGYELWTDVVKKAINE
ncbi:GDSL-type esterase/lipase family protein [Rubinisphaera margarita]|uniref:GDSL-type esterase/lipase family protein n=1 Tax=Rubinisphaera margarita TaxID=2909586 RepID=UPI001EE821AA|nr:GDSL-type esterase/lipase family protein [Rubinisphaera margarita]MCG6158514.1 GDSL-type esterase/lipase family protein [Rubinisphaera margarita]